jgi:hypothetical protein
VFLSEGGTVKNRIGVGKAVILAGLVVLALGGCGPTVPKYPQVKGKIVFKDGNVALLAGGYVRFESVSDPNVRAVGPIDDDGTFVMGSPGKEKTDKMIAGVPEGEYRARIELPAGETEEGKPRAVIHRRYLDFKTSGLRYTVGPGVNDITIEVQKND